MLLLLVKVKAAHLDDTEWPQAEKTIEICLVDTNVHSDTDENSVNYCIAICTAVLPILPAVQSLFVPICLLSLNPVSAYKLSS
jgi:hypothetical protein